VIDRPGRLLLLGHPVAQSLSPRFQNAALRAAGIPFVYEARDVAPEALPEVLAQLRAERAAGNVTHPHKRAVAARCDRLTALAERCGAVNTFWHEEGALVGDNTDVGGFEMVARALLGERSASARVALIGAGGAAGAVLAAVEGWESATVRVYNRHMPRAEELVARFPRIATTAVTVGDALYHATLVVNATPLGMRDGDPFPVEIESLPSGSAVFDLVYRAEETAWVRAARAAGHWAADGRGMLVEQGALAFERWFGRAPDRNVMWTAMA
jgi:shikimate dehydrogenase